MRASAVQAKEDDTGNVAMFSHSQTSEASGMDVGVLEALAARIQKRMPNMPKVNVLASPLDAPPALRDYIEQQGAMDDVEGAMHKGELYLFASGLPDVLRAEHVLAEHEAAHFGLRAILGDSLKSAMQSIYNNNATVRQAATELQKRGKLSNAEATEEVIVDIPSSQLAKLQGWRKVVQQARSWLADHGFENMAAQLSNWLDGTLTDQQRADLMVANLVRAARSYVAGKRGKRVKVRTNTLLPGTLAENAAKQEQWLSTEARARGYSDIDQLAEKNYPLFENLAKLWQKKNPGESLLSRGDQTDTPAFKEWYGDWQGATNGRTEDGRGSADVNSTQRPAGVEGDTSRRTAVGNFTFPGASGPVGGDGKPVVFFHGTRDNVNAFDTQHPNRKDKGWLGRGIYAASDSQDAESYSRMKPGNESPVVMPLFMAVKNPYVASVAVKQRLKNASQAEIDAFTQDLKSKGHDGVVMPFSDGHVELMAFDPTQVKSAIGNNGNFDGTNPDIRMSRGTNDAMTQSNDVVGNQGGRSADGSTPGARDKYAISREIALLKEKYSSLPFNDAARQNLKDRLNALRDEFASFKSTRPSKPSDEALAARYDTPSSVPADVRDWVKQNASIITSDASDAVRWGRIDDTLNDERYPGGRISIYRAVANGDEIRAGDWVTTERKYAEEHLDRYLGGKGEILEDSVDGRDVLTSPTGNSEEAIYAPRQYSGPAENESPAPDGDGAPMLSRGSPPPGQLPPSQPATPQNQWQALKAKVADLTSAEAIDKLIYEFQDKYIDLKRLRDHIKAIGGTISDLNDAYQGEELYHARVAKRTQDFLADEIRPLMGDLRTRGVSMEALETYLHARHAPEANKAMAERNPTQDMIDAGKAKADADVKALELQLQTATAQGTATRALQDALKQAQDERNNWRSTQAFKGTEEERLSLSGMSDAQAQAVMDALAPGKLQHLQALAARVDAINAKTLDVEVQYGLTDAASVQAQRNAYQFYIPLHRDEAHESGTSHPIGQGFSVKGDASKRRTGSNAKVTHILGHVAMKRESTLTRGEKNNVAKKLYLMAAQNPDADYWSVDKPPTLETIDKKTGFVRTGIDPMYKNKPNVVMVRIGGKDAFITFNEHNSQAVRLAEAVKNADVGDLGKGMAIMAWFTRWFSAVNTQYNPVFGVINFLRDVQGAALNLSTTPIAGKQLELATHVVPAMRAIYRDKQGKGAANPSNAQWIKLWGELQEVGGITGYRDMYADPKDRVQALEQELSKLERGPISEKAHAAFDWLGDYNEAMENSTRLAAYKVAVDSGMSRQQAASLAKNLTVNFNRKGRKGREINAGYAFFNAAIQGSARMVETLRSPMGKRIMQGGLALGVANTLLGMVMMGGGDDEDDNGWDKIPDFIKDRNLIIPLGREDYFAIPMPLGFNVLPNIGRVMTEAVFGGPDKTLAGGVGKVLASLLDAFNPLGGGTDPSQTIMPTVLDPIVALWRNKDWTGKPVYRDDNNPLDPTPGHLRTKDSASTPSKWVSKALNRLTEGTDYKPGGISWTPDQLDYVVGQITGGTGRELMKLNQVVTTPFTGDELPSYKIPLLGRLYGNTRGPSGQSQKFYENVRAINEAENELRGRVKDGVDDGDYFKEDPLANLVGEGNGAEKQVRQLRKMRQMIAKEGLAGYQAEVRDINEQIGEVMKDLNREVSKAKREAAAQ